MKQSQHFLENVEHCGQLAERATDEPTYKRYKRMEAAWRALAVEQDGWMARRNSAISLRSSLIQLFYRETAFPVVVVGTRCGLFRM
jgi:hypothetical protein